MERTFLAIKPDGVQRGLVGEIIRRFEAKGFTLVGLKFMTVSRNLAEQHYDVHQEKPFFAGLVEFITSGPVVAMVWEGDGVVASARKMIGSTNPLTAEPGTIRGDLGVNIGRNMIHGSDAVDTANREISLWFKEEELVNWQPSLTADRLDSRIGCPKSRQFRHRVPQAVIPLGETSLSVVYWHSGQLWILTLRSFSDMSIASRTSLGCTVPPAKLLVSAHPI